MIAGARFTSAAELLCDVFALADVLDKLARETKAAFTFDKLVGSVSESAGGMIAFFAL